MDPEKVKRETKDEMYDKMPLRDLIVKLITWIHHSNFPVNFQGINQSDQNYR